MRGMSIDASQKKKREKHAGPPCHHYPHRYKTEARHQAMLASKRRCDERRRAARTPPVFESHGYDIKRRIQLILAAINRRCRHHPRYAGRGIQNFLIHDDLLSIWNRDGAGQMSRPSIDRIDNDGNYELSNVRFIELAENVRRGVQVREAKRQSNLSINSDFHASNTNLE